ncbi:MAG: hypothetical protein ACLRWP_04670 [Bilophila wadsworthia]
MVLVTQITAIIRVTPWRNLKQRRNLRLHRRHGRTPDRRRMPQASIPAGIGFNIGGNHRSEGRPGHHDAGVPYFGIWGPTRVRQWTMPDG